MRLDSRDLLPENRGKHRLEDPIGSTESDPRVLARQLIDELVVGNESVRLVVSTNQPRRLVEQPFGAGAPRRRRGIDSIEQHLDSANAIGRSR